jgi:hypothetical protein
MPSRKPWRITRRRLWQHDWAVWVDFAVYAYNSGRHTTVALSPNDLMLGRKLRAPNELLRRAGVKEAGEMTQYHRQLLAAMKHSHECAERARRREQQQQARYYDRRARQKTTFTMGDRVWMYRPPRGAKASKFVHLWIGPLRIIEEAGFDNYLVEREDEDEGHEQFIAHVSFLVTYHSPIALLGKVAEDLDAQLEYEDGGEDQHEGDDETTAAVARATTAPVQAAAASGAAKRDRRT